MRFILSRAASRGHGRCLGLWDVSVAFFHGTIEEGVFVRPPKNMRKDTTIWRLLKDMYGTQVASSRWQSDGHWKVLTCVPCAAYNETEGSLVMFHGADFLAEGWSKGVFSAQKDPMERIWIFVSTRSQTRGCIDHNLVTGRRETCRYAIQTGYWKGTSKHVERVERDWAGNLHVSVKSVAIHCTGQNGCGVCYERGEITNNKSWCAGIAVVETCGKLPGWTSRDNDKLSVPKQSITDRLLQRCRLGLRRDNTIVNDSWSIDARRSLAWGMVSNIESQGFVVRRVGAKDLEQQEACWWNTSVTKLERQRKHLYSTVTLLRAVAWHNSWVLENVVTLKWNGCGYTNHGREEVGDETRFDRVKRCWHRNEGVDERQDMETDAPDGNEFGCWRGVSCAAANGDKHGDVESWPWNVHIHAVIKKKLSVRW